MRVKNDRMSMKTDGKYLAAIAPWRIGENVEI